MKRIGLFWVIPVLSIVLSLFIYVSAMMRGQAIQTEAQLALKSTTELVIRLIQNRAQADMANKDKSAQVLDSMLLGTMHAGVRYVAIQNKQGVLAQSPAKVHLSKWEKDPFLAQGCDMAVLFRLIDASEPLVFEGIGQVLMPLHGIAIVRVGVDASAMVATVAQMDFRRKIVLVLAALLIFFSIAVTLVLSHGEKRRQRAEQRLMKQEAERRHWQMLGQLAATVAHEVRNPLNTIRMAAQRLGREFEIAKQDQEEFRELVAVLTSEGDRVDHVVTEFLELGKPLVLETKTVRVDNVVEQVLIPMRIRAEQERKKLVFKSGHKGSIELDPRRFTQIVSNLILNAMNAMNEGGTVWVSTEEKQGALCLEVKDNGRGMDSETLEKVMQPFFTTRARGTGLGLPLAKRLAEAHGGSLKLTSKLGSGTQAQMLLPNITNTKKGELA